MVNMYGLDYEKSKNYWSNVPASLNGMLGGFSSLTVADIQDSDLFLRKLFLMVDGPSKNRALDCGAGIGRITGNLLCKYFRHVDMLEQEEKFLDKAKLIFQGSNVENFYCAGLQEFSPTLNQKYDVIWIQWVLGYLTDDDLVEFLKKCCNMLNTDGVIIVKENLSKQEEGEIDLVDSSITRSFEQYCLQFRRANLICKAMKRQKNFPSTLYKVEMFALQPADQLVSLYDI